MATKTEYLQLTKPELNDRISLADINLNYDTIDDAIAKLNSTITAQREIIADLKARLEAIEE